MPTKTVRNRLTALILLTWAASMLASSIAYSAEKWIGEKFMPKAGAKFVIENEEVPYRDIRFPLYVSEIHGDLLRVGKAWIKKEQVVPLQDASAYYTDYLRDHPQSSWAYANRGITWQEKGEYDKALKDYTESIRLDPKYALAYNYRGNVWQNKGDYANAVKDSNSPRNMCGPTSIAAICG